jgi:tripartite-type tricarboxylate transporter receptor subunit TctC
MRTSLLKHLLCVALIAPCAALAQTWPVKPVRWILPNSAGSGPDTVARLAAARLEQALGQPFLIENRPGANFFIAAEAIAKSAPDGYTVGLGSGVIASINPNLFKTLPYNPDRDFEYIAMLVDTVWTVIGTSSSFPASTFAEFIELAKKNPGKYSYQVTVPINGIWWKSVTKKLGIQMLEVEYKSTPQAVQDQLSGRTDLFVNAVTGYLEHMRAGKLKGLVLGGDVPFPGLDLPSINKFAPGSSLETWISIMGPAGMPQPMVQRLNRAVDAIVKEPEFQKRLLAIGWGNAQGARTPAAVAENARAERARWAEITRQAGVVPE